MKRWRVQFDPAKVEYAGYSGEGSEPEPCFYILDAHTDERDYNRVFVTARDPLDAWVKASKYARGELS